MPKIIVCTTKPEHFLIFLCAHSFFLSELKHDPSVPQTVLFLMACHLGIPVLIMMSQQPTPAPGSSHSSSGRFRGLSLVCVCVCMWSSILGLMGPIGTDGSLPQMGCDLIEWWLPISSPSKRSLADSLWNSSVKWCEGSGGWFVWLLGPVRFDHRAFTTDSCPDAPELRIKPDGGLPGAVNFTEYFPLLQALEL